MSLDAVGVVVVAHNTRDEVVACLQTLPEALLVATAVVDNASHDATASTVRRRFPHVKVLELANAGFGRGVNAGARVVDGEFLLVANADVRFGPGAIERLAVALRDHPSVGAVGPRVEDFDGDLQASARRLPSVSMIVGHAILGRVRPGNRWSRAYHAADLDPSGAREADWLSGCAFMVRRSAFESVGGFDPGYFLFAEDVDLGVRLREAGWSLRYVPEAVVRHRQGASTSSRPMRTVMEHARSLDRFHRRHRRSVVGRLATPLVRLGLVAWTMAGWLARLRDRDRGRRGVAN